MSKREKLHELEEHTAKFVYKIQYGDLTPEEIAKLVRRSRNLLRQAVQEEIDPAEYEDAVKRGVLSGKQSRS